MNVTEQFLPPNGACLLGSVNLTRFVINPFTPKASFDWRKYRKVVDVFSRMLDNVVDVSGLPLEAQREELLAKRRHGMGFLGLGSAISMLGMQYGDQDSITFTSNVSCDMAIQSYRTGIKLAKEKGAAPILQIKDNLSLWLDSKFMQRIWETEPSLKALAMKYGCRYTHALSIAPTGTISLSVNNNVSSGIEPSFAHKYTRNVIKEGKKSKQAIDVYSYEMLLYKQLFNTDDVPETFSTTESVTWEQHVDIQAAAQYWVDSSISKTINIPTDTSFEEFKDVYLYACDKGLKGVTTFRFNPEAFQGVLVKEEDLNNTSYEFTLENGEKIVVRGNDTLLYDGEEHTAANLYDSLKEGYYGKY